MATKYAKTAQTGNTGVALVQAVVTDADAIYRPFESNDLGVDGAIELLTENREPSGALVLAQIKAGASYIRNGRFYVDADKDHFETWSRYAVPVVGIVCDDATKQARWVDISNYLRTNPEVVSKGPYSIEAPAQNAFSGAEFPKFVARFRAPAATPTQVNITPNLLIRPWQPADAKPTRVLLDTIAADYPSFQQWLFKKFNDAGASKKVVVVGKVIAAFSMWQAKDERNIKLQTFIVGSQYRGTSLGQHLLYHELRSWAENPKVERVHVTVASSKSDLIAYFRSFGFRVEGIAANRYPRPAPELILTKYLLREIVRTPNELRKLASKLAENFLGIVPAGSSRFGVLASDFAVPILCPAVTMTVNDAQKTVSPRLQLKDEKGQVLLEHDDESLMRQFYPLRLHLKDKRYLLVPIYPAWVKAMLSLSGPHTPLKLRVDNAYYCYPKFTDLTKGDFVLFYETKKEGGSGGVIGGAMVQEVRVDYPSNLFKDFAKLGIYKLKDIKRHVNSQGDAMAIRFAFFEPFKKTVPLANLRKHLGHTTNVQGLTPIDRDAFEKVRNEALT
jgi:ribosomal protein S18 acetylase RimI-like enzyme/predicted transcriptional regulator